MNPDRVENEIRSALRKQAALVDRWIDHREMDRGGHGRQRSGAGRLRSFLAGMVALTMFVVVSAATIWIRSNPPGRSDRAAPGSAPSATGSSSPTSCPLPEFRPTRLPWLPASSPLPTPEEVTYEGGASSLVWFQDPQARWEGRYLALTTYRTGPFGPLEDLAGSPTVTVHDQTGHLIWVGDPGVGELAIVWSEGSGECPWFALRMITTGLTQSAAEAQLRAVAASLG
ncbi:MAG TPA: hypothetical protein VNO79_04515 [Actinomycetota bacterium]|nr:hypothetical protein [Actinomycetota bacterium]